MIKKPVTKKDSVKNVIKCGMLWGFQTPPKQSGTGMSHLSDIIKICANIFALNYNFRKSIT